jgi:hypothetical protein
MAAVVSLIFAAPAVAQEDGVFIDPGSPSGKEYAIPLEDERRLADPAQEPSAEIQQGSRSSPIFGTGISDGDAEGDASAGAPTSAGEDRDREPFADASRERDPHVSRDDDAVIRGATANPGAPSGGVEVPLTFGGVAVGVLLVGGLAGLLLRRRA